MIEIRSVYVFVPGGLPFKVTNVSFSTLVQGKKYIWHHLVDPKVVIPPFGHNVKFCSNALSSSLGFGLYPFASLKESQAITLIL